MFLALFGTVLTLFGIYAVFWCIRLKDYWKRLGVPHVPSVFPLLGPFRNVFMLREQVTETFQRIYSHPDAKNQPFVGFHLFHKPAILVRDPELVKRVLIKDFNYFNNRYNGANPQYDPMGANNLFQIKNPTWRKLRLKLSPIFTSGKMKQMFYMIEKVSKDLTERISKNPILETRSLFASFTIDIISLVAFGTEANCLKSPETSEFKQKALKSSMWHKISFVTKFFLPGLFKYFKMSTFHPAFENFLRNLFNGVMSHRIASGNVRNDLVDALIAIKNAETDKSLFTEDVILAQAAVFFNAGFETSSSTLTFVFYYLAKHRDVQQNLRAEIKQALVKNNGALTYENFMHELPYLEAVINETLRIHPIVPFLDRECVAPGYSLEPYSNFVLPVKMPVFIPITSIHNDPMYYSNPEKFDPSRFEGQPSSNYTFMPFGLGPRNCIGERFAWMQVRFAIITVLRSFSVEFADKMEPTDDLDKTCLLARFNGALNLKFTPDELF